MDFKIYTWIEENIKLQPILNIFRGILTYCYIKYVNTNIIIYNNNANEIK